MPDRSLRFLLLGEDKSASKALKGVAAEAGRTHGHLAALAGTFIGGAAVAGVLGFAKSSVDAFKDTTKSAIGLRRVIGGTVEDASRYNFAAHESGVANETLSKSLKLLSKNLIASEKIKEVHTRQHKLEIVMVPKLVKGQIKYVKALKDTGDTTTKFVKVSKDLGFVWKDAHGAVLPMTKLLPRIADKFKAMPDGVEKTALALKLFGRGGTEMLPFLNRGAAGIAELTKESDKFGATITGKDAAGLKEYVKSQREWKAALEGVKISLGRELMPTFSQWAKYLSDHAPQINAFARKDLPALGHALGEAGRIVRDDLYPPVEKTFTFLSDHQGIAKVLGEAAIGAVAFTKAMKGVVAVKGAIGVLRGFALAETAVATSSTAVGLAAPGAVTGLGGLASAIGGLTLPELLGPLAALAGTLERVKAIADGLGGNIGPLLHLSTFGIGPKPKSKTADTDLTKYVAGLSPAKREQMYGWYPQLRPPKTPAIGTYSDHSGNVTHVTHVHIDGKKVATVVNAHNAKSSRNGSTSARRAAS